MHNQYPPGLVYTFPVCTELQTFTQYLNFSTYILHTATWLLKKRDNLLKIAKKSSPTVGHYYFKTGMKSQLFYVFLYQVCGFKTGMKKSKLVLN